MLVPARSRDAAATAAPTGLVAGTRIDGFGATEVRGMDGGRSLRACRRPANMHPIVARAPS